MYDFLYIQECFRDFSCEVQEETGIDNLEIIDFVSEVPGAKISDTVSIFLCSTDQDEILMEPEKFSQWKWFDKDNFPEKFISDVERAK